MAIEGRLTKKKMIDRKSLFKQPAEPLVKAAGAAPSAQPCPCAAAALKVGRGEPRRATVKTQGWDGTAEPALLTPRRILCHRTKTPAPSRRSPER